MLLHCRRSLQDKPWANFIKLQKGIVKITGLISEYDHSLTYYFVSTASMKVTCSHALPLSLSFFRPFLEASTTAIACTLSSPKNARASNGHRIFDVRGSTGSTSERVASSKLPPFQNYSGARWVVPCLLSWCQSGFSSYLMMVFGTRFHAMVFCPRITNRLSQRRVWIRPIYCPRNFSCQNFFVSWGWPPGNPKPQSQ